MTQTLINFFPSSSALILFFKETNYRCSILYCKQHFVGTTRKSLKAYFFEKSLSLIFKMMNEGQSKTGTIVEVPKQPPFFWPILYGIYSPIYLTFLKLLYSVITYFTKYQSSQKYYYPILLIKAGVKNNESQVNPHN